MRVNSPYVLLNIRASPLTCVKIYVYFNVIIYIFYFIYLFFKILCVRTQFVTNHDHMVLGSYVKGPNNIICKAWA